MNQRGPEPAVEQLEGQMTIDDAPDPGHSTPDRCSIDLTDDEFGEAAEAVNEVVVHLPDVDAS